MKHLKNTGASRNCGRKHTLQTAPFYITSKTNIKYLTGFSGSRGSILLTPNMLYLFTDARYFEETKKQTHLLGAINTPRCKSVQKALQRLKTFGYEPKASPKNVVSSRNCRSKHSFQKGIKLKLVQFEKTGAHPLAPLVKKHRIKTLQFEENHITYAGYRKLRKLLKRVTLTPTSDIIERVRAVKTSREIKYIQEAQHITENIFQTLKKIIKPGQTEIKIEQQIKKFAEEYGADGLSFPPVIAFGENSSIPHHQNSDRKLKKGDIILIDMGVVYKGYHADMTRTLFTTKPTPFQKKIYNLVREAHEKAAHMLKQGEKVWKIETNIRKFLGSHEKYFTHALGHGIGLEIHESPSLSEKIEEKRNQQMLEEDMLTTIEPGLYFPGKFGIRLENIYQITKNGYKNFNKTQLDIENNIVK